MQVETYLEPKKIESNNRSDDRLNDRLDILRRNGFYAQAKVERLASLEMFPMSEAEKEAWQTALPGRHFSFKTYTHEDAIPTGVIALYEDCTKENLFNGYQIWDNSHSDPILIGTIDRHHYLLARWGEEEFVDPFVLAAHNKRKEKIQAGIFLGSLMFTIGALIYATFVISQIVPPV